MSSWWGALRGLADGHAARAAGVPRAADRSWQLPERHRLDPCNQGRGVRQPPELRAAEARRGDQCPADNRLDVRHRSDTLDVPAPITGCQEASLQILRRGVSQDGMSTSASRMTRRGVPGWDVDERLQDDKKRVTTFWKALPV